jgi:Fe-S cluster assembly protein SufD
MATVTLLSEQLKHIAEKTTFSLPTRRDETWKYVDLNRLLSLTMPNTLQKGAPQKRAGLAGSDTVYCIDGVFQNSTLPEGVLMSETDLDELDASSKLSIFQQLQPEQKRLTLTISKTLVRPLVIVFEAEHHGLQTQNLSIVLASNTHATVCIQYNTQAPEAEILNMTKLTTQLQASATLELVIENSSGPQIHQLSQHSATLAEKATLKLYTLSQETPLSRHETTVNLVGEGAHVDHYGLSVLGHTSHVHEVTQFNHMIPHTSSQQLYKTILTGQAKSDFNGTIAIDRSAQKTDAAQLNQNLLLSEEARAYSRPQLRIDADDVKCAHGATVGQLDDVQLFYMLSRGFSAEQAKTVLTLGFAGEILDKLPIESLKQTFLSTLKTTVGGAN